MPIQKLPYLNRHVNRHKKVMWCVRVDRTQPRIWIKAEYGSKEFMEAYRLAIAGTPLPKVHGLREGEAFTVGWAINRYMGSRQWAKLAPESRKQLSYQFTRIHANVGKLQLKRITPAVVMESRDKRAGVPSDANKFVRAVKLLFEFAVANTWVVLNPASGVGKLKTSKTGEGFVIWRAEHLAAFERRWPVGTMQRLAYEIVRCTGLRRSDVCRFGPQHIREGGYSITPQKTAHTGMVAYGDVLARLAESLEATPHGSETFLITEHSTPFRTSASFGNWFGKACREAGVPGSAHGIRKSVASMAAENGATTAQLNSLLGWSHRSKESATYIDKADRSKMARDASKLIVHPGLLGVGKKPISD